MGPLAPEQAMMMALEEGSKGAGFVSPNPLVGCAILDQNYQLIALAHHERVGEGHAEVNALKQIQNTTLLNGAHIYVTLEPCAHEGRTPSCAKTLAELPIASVTYGLEDPNPLVSGKGAEILRASGKKVQIFDGLKDELEELAEIFLMNQRQGRPFVGVKVASSLDGRIALADGTSQWITGESARTQVQYLRGIYDAMVTGAGTILKDDPRLNSRDPRFANKQQKLIVLDPDGETLSRIAEWNFAKARSSDDIFVVVRPGLARPLSVGRALEVPVLDQGFDLKELLQTLHELAIHSVLVEAGGFTVSRFLRAGLVDRLYLFMAAKILGEGMSWTEGLKIRTLAETPRLRKIRVQTFGEDLLLTARLRS